MLSFQDVGAGYGLTTVLRNISFDVEPGRVAALLGPNGAGKSTLLRTASGLLSPSAGKVMVRGEDVRHQRPFQRARKGVCHIPEGRGIFPRLTVRENLRAFASRGCESDAFSNAVAAFPILGERASQPAGTLSGGEQQMLAMTRALVGKPDLVLIDEPTLGLAPQIVDLVYEFLASLAAEGTSMLIVEQYIDKVLGIADDVHVLVNGELVHSGPATSLDREALGTHYISAKI